MPLEDLRFPVKFLSWVEIETRVGPEVHDRARHEHLMALAPQQEITTRGHAAGARRLTFFTMDLDFVRPRHSTSAGKRFFANETPMIAERLRPIFAKDQRPLLVRHLIFGFTLVPIPMIRTGLAEFAVLIIFWPISRGGEMGLGLLFWGTLFSVPVLLIFLAWSLPGAGRPGLPKRSIGALVLLIAYHPVRLYLDGTFYSEKALATVSRIHEQFPIVWGFKHLDTPLLMGLIVWTVLRRQSAESKEKILFHWLLFLCVLWATCAFFDSLVGYSLSFLFSAPQN